MSGLREYEFRVESRDVDFRRQATIMALGDYILHTAGTDADRNGVGVRDLNAGHGSSWVLTRMAMEVRRMPAEHELLRIRTWVSEVTRIMTTRNFHVYDSIGEPLASAVTNWAMINISSRRPMDLSLLDDYQKITQDIPCPIEKPSKLESPGGKHSYGHTVLYSDIDFNCHANSMKYLQWVVDTLPMEMLRKKIFRRVDINFIRESLHGQRLSIITDFPDGNLYEIRDEESRPVCRISFEME